MDIIDEAVLCVHEGRCATGVAFAVTLLRVVDVPYAGNVRVPGCTVSVVNCQARISTAHEAASRMAMLLLIVNSAAIVRGVAESGFTSSQDTIRTQFTVGKELQHSVHCEEQLEH